MASTGGFFRRVVPLVGLLVLLVAPTPSTNAQCTQVGCTAPDACHSAGGCDPDTGTCSTQQSISLVNCQNGQSRMRYKNSAANNTPGLTQRTYQSGYMRAGQTMSNERSNHYGNL